MRFYAAGGTIAEVKDNENYTNWSNWSNWTDTGQGSTNRHRYRTRTRTHTYRISAGKYFINNVTIGGLRSTGSLDLNNADAYVPAWGDFSGNRSYTISSSNVLNNDLVFVNSSSTGLSEALTPVMANEHDYVYVIPGSKATFTLNYTIKNKMSGCAKRK